MFRRSSVSHSAPWHKKQTEVKFHKWRTVTSCLNRWHLQTWQLLSCRYYRFLFDSHLTPLSFFSYEGNIYNLFSHLEGIWVGRHIVDDHYWKKVEALSYNLTHRTKPNMFSILSRYNLLSLHILLIFTRYSFYILSDNANSSRTNSRTKNITVQFDIKMAVTM